MRGQSCKQPCTTRKWPCGPACVRCINAPAGAYLGSMQAAPFKRLRMSYGMQSHPAGCCMTAGLTIGEHCCSSWISDPCQQSGHIWYDLTHSQALMKISLAMQTVQNELVPAHSLHPYLPHHSSLMLHPSTKYPLTAHPSQLLHPGFKPEGIDRMHDAVRILAVL